MANYLRIPARTDIRRSYAITFGLTPGYEADPEPVDVVARRISLHPLAAAGRTDALTAHGHWMVGRIRAGQPYLTGVFQDVLVSYAWPRPENGGAANCRLEPGLAFTGEVSVLYAAAVTDEQAVDMLDELAGLLAGAARQERAYVAYRDHTWVLEAHP